MPHIFKITATVHPAHGEITLWSKDTISSISASVIPSPVLLVCLGHLLSLCCQKIRMILLLWDNQGCNYAVSAAAICPFGEKILPLCGTGFAVKQTRDLRKEGGAGGGVVYVNVNPWKSKSMEIPSGLGCRNTPIREEEEVVKRLCVPRAWEAQKGPPDIWQLGGSAFRKLPDYIDQVEMRWEINEH